jgi:hypothetical protein
MSSLHGIRLVTSLSVGDFSFQDSWDEVILTLEINIDGGILLGIWLEMAGIIKLPG